MTPTIGRIVHYVLANGEHRPGIIVRTWPTDDEKVNLQLFVDGSNDCAAEPQANYSTGVIWKTSAPHDEEKKPNSWHWPERDDA